MDLASARNRIGGVEQEIQKHLAQIRGEALHEGHKIGKLRGYRNRRSLERRPALNTAAGEIDRLRDDLAKLRRCAVVFFTPFTQLPNPRDRAGCIFYGMVESLQS